jgi:hypothetical protein
MNRFEFLPRVEDASGRRAHTGCAVSIGIERRSRVRRARSYRESAAGALLDGEDEYFRMRGDYFGFGPAIEPSSPSDRSPGTPAVRRAIFATRAEISVAPRLL